MIITFEYSASFISKLGPTPAPIVYIIVFISSFLNISSIFVFSVFNTLPLKGKIAWNLLSLPCLAEPPAESPSTINNSLCVLSLD